MHVVFIVQKEGWEIESRQFFRKKHELGSGGKKWYADIIDGVTKEQVRTFLVRASGATDIKFSEDENASAATQTRVRNGGSGFEV